MMRMTRTRCMVVAVVVGLVGCDTRPPLSPSLSPPLPPSPTTGVQLAGTVADVFFRPLAGARIEILDGPHAGLSTMTNADGRFGFVGAFNETTHFRASSDGYIASTQPFPARCAACNPNWWLHFSLPTGAPHPDIAGDYTMTFTADAACRGLPDDARSATYDATLTLQIGSNVPINSWYTATVSGPSPLMKNEFQVGIDASQFVAWMGDLHGLAVPVWEVAPKTYLTFADGEATATVTDSSAISAVFSASVARCEVATDWGGRRNCESGAVVRHDRCESSRHQLILKRR